MPKKKTISATKIVKGQARAAVGTPPPSRPLPDRRADANRKTEKHKKRIADLRESE
jgi:hypothetical protein